ncbi:MAG TPA: hypothetical protein VLX92_20110 [Kofleriaceae bacterium]|nr:hypothetical protein [Kofleriaceae bacterium]
MKLIRVLSLLFVVSAASVAFADTPPAKSAPPPAAGSGGTVSDADAKKFLVFWDKLVDLIIADKDSCPKMANDINALIDANKDLMDLAKKAAAAGKKLPPDAEKHIQDTVGKLVPAMQKCQADKGVQAAFGRLNMK